MSELGSEGAERPETDTATQTAGPTVPRDHHASKERTTTAIPNVRQAEMRDTQWPVLRLAYDVHAHVRLNRSTDAEALLAGRVVTIRKLGGVCFLELVDPSGSIQLIAAKEDLTPSDWEAVRTLRKGQRITAHGKVGHSRSGETSLVLERAPVCHGAPVTPNEELDEARVGRQIFAARLRQRVVEQFKREGHIEVEPTLISATRACPSPEPLRVQRDGFGESAYLLPSPASQLTDAIASGLVRVFAVSRCFSTAYRGDSPGPGSLVLMAKSLDLTVEEQRDLLRRVVPELLAELDLASDWTPAFEIVSQPPSLCDGHVTEITEAWQAIIPPARVLGEGAHERLDGGAEISTCVLYLEPLIELLRGPETSSALLSRTPRPSRTRERHAGTNDDQPPAGRRLSKLEWAWARRTPGSALVRGRTERFDAVTSLLCSPLAYRYPSLQQSLEAPSVEWIFHAFREFVRGEFDPAASSRPRPRQLRPEITGERTAGFDEMEAYLERCAGELVHGDGVRSVRTRSAGDSAQDVYDLVTHPLLAHERNKRNLDITSFRARIEPQLAREDRLLFVVPACPFKDQNALRTVGGPSFPDAGELAFLTSLHLLAGAVHQVHPAGAEWAILTDGELYADIFGVHRHDAIRYRERLQRFRSALNLQSTVSIIDLKDVLDNFRSAVGGDFVDALFRRLRTALRALLGRGDEFGEAFGVLVDGMRWNLASAHLREQHSPESIWTLLLAPSDTDLVPSLRVPWGELQDRAIEAAVEYGTINLVLRYGDIVDRTFPGAIRGTVHPKPGQLAVRTYGSAYPWNAVAFRNSATVAPGMFESRPLYELASRGPLRRVLLEDHGSDALFYLERS